MNHSKPLEIPQQQLLIEHPVNGDIVPQRPLDGYINATRLCQQAGKRLNNYLRNDSTQAFLEELASVTRIRVTELVHVIQGGPPLNQGTWVHPRVAINLGQWLSPEFAVQVTEWVFDWMTGRTRPYMPVHVRRYLLNKSKIQHTHFSMLNEIYLGLLAPLEDRGVILPDNMMPDISTGRMFSGFLRSKGIDPSEFPTYQHEFAPPDGRIVQARLYPIEHLPDFRRYFHEIWLQDHAERYFTTRFKAALPFIDQIKKLPPPSV